MHVAADIASACRALVLKHADGKTVSLNPDFMLELLSDSSQHRSPSRSSAYQLPADAERYAQVRLHSLPSFVHGCMQV